MAEQTSSKPMLSVENVSKHFGGLRAVHEASLTIQTGRITAVIGPNGAGKTTLFALVTGFLTPSSGPNTVPTPPMIGASNASTEIAGP